MTARLVVSTAVAVAVSVVAFVVLATDGGGGDAGRLDDSRARDTGWSDEGRRVFAAMGCGSCHRLAAAGSTGTIGPDLDEELAGQSFTTIS